MEISLQYCGAKTPCSISSRRLFQNQSSLSQRLCFASSVLSSSEGLYSSVKAKQLFCRSKILSVTCERSVVDVLEKTQLENPSLGENDKQLSCVMKFGGSSIASAERMREVAHLILSFPEERPVIVLSAMANKLLLVWYLSVVL